MRIGALVVVALLLAGCAGDDDASDAEDAAGAVDASDGAGSDAAPITSEPAGCEGRADQPSGLSELTLRSGGESREARVNVPQGYRPTDPHGLVLAFHGFSSNAVQTDAYSALPIQAAASDLIVVTPEGLGSPQAWRLGSDAEIRFVTDLIDLMAEDYCIDAGRVFATGISNGSALTAALACHLDDRLAAVALVAASVPPVACGNDDRMPVLAFHGTADGTVPYEGGEVTSGGASDGVRLPGVEEALGAWADQNRCGRDPETMRIEPDVEVTRYAGCDAPTELYTVEGAGHVWPGGLSAPALDARLGPNTDTIDATAIMLDFFAEQAES